MTEGTPIYDADITVCDVETTGLNPQTNRIIEFAAVKIKNGEITDRYSSLINPECFVPYEITCLTGITNEDVRNRPTFAEALPEMNKFLQPNAGAKFIFAGHNVMFDYKFLASSISRADYRYNFTAHTLCTCKIARRLLRRLKSKSLHSLCEHFDIRQLNKHRALDDTLATARILIRFIEELSSTLQMDTIEEILSYQNSRIYSSTLIQPALKRMNLNLRSLPKKPGVYFMKAKSGEIIYIGKAKNLRERVSSYFRHNSSLPPKIQRLIANIHKLEYEVTNSELSALILESKLIKKNKPRFNTAIKRFRFHPFLKLDVQQDYPKIEKVYELENDGANYYGPFTSGLTVNGLLKDIKESFKLRKCEGIRRLKPAAEHSTCMYYEMNKCNAPCNFTQSLADYRMEVDTVHNYITSNAEGSARWSYNNKMTEYAEQMDYERAAFARDRLNDMNRVMRYRKVITSAINNKKIVIKCDSGYLREIFFIQNGKLAETFVYETNKKEQAEAASAKITEAADYLFFSLSKYARHKYSAEELDEIKVISNWLALNDEKNSVLEIEPQHTKEQITEFLTS